MAAAKAPAAEAPKLVEVVIVRGTYHDVVDGERVAYGPGKTVSVTPEEAEALKRTGFVRTDDYLPPEEVQDGQLRISAADGPTVTNVTPAG